MNDLLELKVSAIIRETPEAISLILENMDGEPVPYRAGQFLTFLFRLNGKELRRSYSLHSAPGIDRHPAVTVKRTENGEISRFLFDHLREGDTLTSLYPAGKFTIEPDASAQRDIFLIGGGSGIAPLFSLLKTILKREPQSHVTLFYSNHNETTAIFYRQLNEWQSACPHAFTCLYFFSDPADRTRQGRLNNGLLEELVNRHIRFDREQAVFFLCGPASLMRMAQLTLIFMGFRSDQLHRENFISPVMTLPVHTHVPDAVTSEISVQFQGKRHNFTVPSGENILQAALDNGIQLPYSCRGGLCSACSCICTKGKIKMLVNEVLTDQDIANGWVLTCVGIPQTKQVEIDFDRK